MVVHANHRIGKRRKCYAAARIVLGESSFEREATVFSEASAAGSVTPSFKRPNIVIARNRRSLKLSLKNPASTCVYMLIGTQTSSALPNVKVPLNPFGPTPITVYGVAFSVNTWPRMLGSDPNLLTHRL